MSYANEAIDIVVGKYTWERGVIERAEPMSVRGIELRVPRIADLILLKLAAGGLRDTIDANNLMEIGPLRYHRWVAIPGPSPTSTPAERRVPEAGHSSHRCVTC